MSAKGQQLLALKSGVCKLQQEMCQPVPTYLPWFYDRHQRYSTGELARIETQTLHRDRTWYQLQHNTGLIQCLFLQSCIIREAFTKTKHPINFVLEDEYRLSRIINTILWYPVALCNLTLFLSLLSWCSTSLHVHPFSSLGRRGWTFSVS